MQTYLGSCYNQFDIVLLANTSITQNGDDAVELFYNGLVIETFGDVDVDGTTGLVNIKIPGMLMETMFGKEYGHLEE